MEIYPEERADEVIDVPVPHTLNGKRLKKDQSTSTEPHYHEVTHDKLSRSNIISLIKSMKSEILTMCDKLEMMEKVVLSNTWKQVSSIQKTVGHVKPIRSVCIRRKRTAGQAELSSDEENNISSTAPNETKRSRNSFSENDRRKIVSYLLRNGDGVSLGAHSEVWKKMAKDISFDSGHTYQSLETHFRRKVIPSLSEFVSTREEYSKLTRK